MERIIVDANPVDDYTFNIKLNTGKILTILFVQAQKANRQIKSVEISYKKSPMNPGIEIQFKRHPGYYYYSLKSILDDNDSSFKIVG